MVSASQLAVQTVKNNLHLTFEEPDSEKRIAQIKRLWVKSEDASFVDPDRVWKGHDELNEVNNGLTKKFEGRVFAEIGECCMLD